MSEPDPRVVLAGERTLLAWIRTGLALMGFGFVVARFGLFMRELARMPERATESHLGASWVGIVLVVLGIVVNAGATVRYLRFNAALSRGEPAHVSLSPPAVLAVGIALIGLILTVVLLASLGQ